MITGILGKQHYSPKIVVGNVVEKADCRSGESHHFIYKRNVPLTRQKSEFVTNEVYL